MPDPFKPVDIAAELKRRDHPLISLARPVIRTRFKVDPTPGAVRKEPTRLLLHNQSSP